MEASQDVVMEYLHSRLVHEETQESDDSGSGSPVPPVPIAPRGIRFSDIHEPRSARKTGGVRQQVSRIQGKDRGSFPKKRGLREPDLMAAFAVTMNSAEFKSPGLLTQRSGLATFPHVHSSAQPHKLRSTSPPRFPRQTSCSTSGHAVRSISPPRMARVPHATVPICPSPPIPLQQAATPTWERWAPKIVCQEPPSTAGKMLLVYTNKLDGPEFVHRQSSPACSTRPPSSLPLTWEGSQQDGPSTPSAEVHVPDTLSQAAASEVLRQRSPLSSTERTRCSAVGGHAVVSERIGFGSPVFVTREPSPHLGTQRMQIHSPLHPINSPISSPRHPIHSPRQTAGLAGTSWPHAGSIHTELQVRTPCRHSVLPTGMCGQVFPCSPREQPAAMRPCPSASASLPGHTVSRGLPSSESAACVQAVCEPGMVVPPRCVAGEQDSLALQMALPALDTRQEQVNMKLPSLGESPVGAAMLSETSFSLTNPFSAFPSIAPPSGASNFSQNISLMGPSCNLASTAYREHNALEPCRVEA